MRMPALTLLHVALALGGLGCGDSSSPIAGDAGSALADAGPVTDEPSTSACNFPSCMAALGAVCIPDGDCVSQVSTGSISICYANGLRYVEAVAITGTGSSAVITATNGPTTCFSGSATTGSLLGSAVTFTLRNPAGEDIATMTQDIATGATSITCKGGQPVALNGACSGGGACMVGTCP